MKIEDAEIDLLLRLRNPEYAAGYLEAVLAEEDERTFLVALRNVIDAFGGMGVLSAKGKLTRQGLYKIASANGNPTIGTLRKVLKPLGLRISVKAAA
jgi:probable addiction module antidote protein